MQSIAEIMDSNAADSSQVTLTKSDYSNSRSDDIHRSCWVCFGTDDDDNSSYPCWVQPCNCRGTTKWVHQSCLLRWVDEKQNGNASIKVSCPQCNAEYILMLPRKGRLLIMLDSIDNMVMKLCPFVAAGTFAAAVYWSATSYGAITVMQIVGRTEGLKMMEQDHVLMLIVGLPAIPVMLIFGELIRWEETVLLLLRKYTPTMPILKHILPSFVYHVEPEPENYAGVPSLVDTICATRVFCSALALPTIAIIIGRLLYENVPSKVQRTLLGGITFILVRGIFKIYHKQQKYLQKCRRKILDYSPENISKHHLKLPADMNSLIVPSLLDVTIPPSPASSLSLPSSPPLSPLSSSSISFISSSNLTS